MDVDHEPQYVPSGVQGIADDLRVLTGLTPEITKVSDRRWRITLVNDRVKMVVDYATKPTKPGRCYWQSSTLEVDGEPRALAKDIHDLARIFRDPDEPPTIITPMPPPAPITEAPAVVQHDYRLLTSKLGPDTVKLGRNSKRWTIGMDSDTAALRMEYLPLGQGKGWGRLFKVVVEGRDRSNEVEDLATALSLMTGIGTKETPDSPSQVTGPAVASRSNSVEVRRSTVIRN